MSMDICTLVSTYTRYPNEAERQIIAQKTVMKFTFLKDPTIEQNSNEWVSRAFMSQVAYSDYRSNNAVKFAKIKYILHKHNCKVCT